ncbi:MAG: PCRF domain-containing protein, partial [Pseudomonadota bacterium]|nr:PCRF domain-containing protein [Pseudomonadota bacterium]
MIARDALDQILARFEFLEASLAEGRGDVAALSRDYAELRPVAEQARAWLTLQRDLAEARALRADPEMRDLAEEELSRLEAALPEAEA